MKPLFDDSNPPQLENETCVAGPSSTLPLTDDDVMEGSLEMTSEPYNKIETETFCYACRQPYRDPTDEAGEGDF
jgi:hypothetical protein